MCKSKKVCKCGVSKSVLLREGISSPKSMSRGLQYHIDTGKPLNDTIFRVGSKTYNELFIEARKYYSRGLLEVKDKKDIALLKDKNYGYLKEITQEPLPIKYKGKTYWIQPSTTKKVFAYLDKELKNVAKINGKTLMFPTKHIEDKLIKENVEELWQVIFRDDEGNEVPYTDETFNSKIEAERWTEKQEWDEQVEVYQDGDYRFITKYHFHNPQDGENYTNYEVIPSKNLQENRIDKLIRESFLKK